MEHIIEFNKYIDNSGGTHPSNSFIDRVCSEFFIKDYTINNDGSIDVKKPVMLISNIKEVNNFLEIPLNFNEVQGFYCYSNNLTTLKGGPKIVKNMNCDGNNLTTLEGAPKNVIVSFSCANNNIITFEGAPEQVGDEFRCDDNPIYEVWKLFKDYSKVELLNDYDALRIEKNEQGELKPVIIIDRLNEFLNDISKESVTEVTGYHIK